MATTTLVKQFNVLPRKQKAPTGRAPNEWHFDLRYVQIEPTPSHVIAIIQPHSQFIHIERLPLETPAGTSGIAFFPESGEQAAPEVAKALLSAFLNNLGQKQIMGDNTPPAFAPWKLTTEDKDLADAVGQEFKRLGVRAVELHKIGVSRKSVNQIMDAAFHKVFVKLRWAAGFPGVVGDVIATPQPIVFHNFHLAPRLDSGKENNAFTLALKYIELVSNARPPKTNDDIDPRALWDEARALVGKVEIKPERVVKEEADAGDADAAFDYGLRLLVGLGCETDRARCRDYLIKAVSSPKASDELKAIAHGILIDWYISSSVGGALRSRYMFAASHHANIAAALCRRVSPPGLHASPAVLVFVCGVFEMQSSGAPELRLWFKDAVEALEFRKAQVASEREKMERKRLKNPNRYACAAVGCEIGTDSRRMLSQCAGKCDVDKKPSYCSKECQKADWKNHKPFCKPGEPCSVIDTSDSHHVGVGPSKQGAIQIPITRPDGSTHLVSSSTLDVQTLKEIKEYAQNADSGSGGSTLPRSVTIELRKYDLEDD